MSAASGRAIRASAAAAPCQWPSRMLPSARQVSSACCDSQPKALSARKMIVSVLEAGFLWRVRVLQGPAARHVQNNHIGFVRRGALAAAAGENGKP